jgi:hypothetical protein
MKSARRGSLRDVEVSEATPIAGEDATPSRSASALYQASRPSSSAEPNQPRARRKSAIALLDVQAPTSDPYQRTERKVYEAAKPAARPSAAPSRLTTVRTLAGALITAALLAAAMMITGRTWPWS